MIITLSVLRNGSFNSCNLRYDKIVCGDRPDKIGRDLYARKLPSDQLITRSVFGTRQISVTAAVAASNLDSRKG